MRADPTEALEDVRETEALEDEERTVDESPDDEVPARAVPKAAEEKDDQQVRVGARRPDAISAERDVQIVAEPSRERDMPPPPELGERTRRIGTIEILGQPESEEPAQADRHVRIAREVEVDLKRITEKSEGGDGGPKLVRGQREDRVGGHAERVRHEQLLREADREAPNPLGGSLDVDDPVGQLGDEVLVADDRSRDQLRKECDEERQADRIALGGMLTPMHVDQIRDRLEREERDPDREMDIGEARSKRSRQGQPRHAADRGKTFEEEIGVLEPGEDREIRRDRQGQRRAPAGALIGAAGAPDPETRAVVEDDRRDHQEDVVGLAPRIEEEARDQQHEVPRATRREQNGGQHRRQEEEEECGRAEDHLADPARGEGRPPQDTHRPADQQT